MTQDILKEVLTEEEYDWCISWCTDPMVHKTIDRLAREVHRLRNTHGNNEKYYMGGHSDGMAQNEGRICELKRQIRSMQEDVGSLFEAIKHGDENHQNWLKAAIDAHFSDEPMPEYQDSYKDIRIKELEAEVEFQEEVLRDTCKEHILSMKEANAERDELRYKIADLSHRAGRAEGRAEEFERRLKKWEEAPRMSHAIYDAIVKGTGSIKIDGGDWAKVPEGEE